MRGATSSDVPTYPLPQRERTNHLEVTSMLRHSSRSASAHQKRCSCCSSVSVGSTRVEFLSRCGMAPLEFLLVIPLLMGLTYGIFTMIRTSLVGLDVIQEAREETFRLVADEQSSQPLEFPLPQDDGVIEHHAQEQVELDSWWKDLKVVPESKCTVMAGPWDQDTVPFLDSQQAMEVHRFVLELLAQNAKIEGIVDTVVNSLSVLLRLHNNYLIIPPALLSEFAQYAADIAGAALYYAHYALYPVKYALQLARDIARALWKWSLARRLQRYVTLMEYGIHAMPEIREAVRGNEIDWRRISRSAARP